MLAIASTEFVSLFSIESGGHFLGKVLHRKLAYFLVVWFEEEGSHYDGTSNKKQNEKSSNKVHSCQLEKKAISLSLKVLYFSNLQMITWPSM